MKSPPGSWTPYGRKRQEKECKHIGMEGLKVFPRRSSSRKNVFSKLAKQEVENAIEYYELEERGLGMRFKQEVKKAALRISRSIERAIEPGARR
ncbi:MAG: hypothetical protein P4L55_15950 [Syntrophobacteraceae bacterium]|nr:hypothetical protein [Syntrophobacteraceae bacterium]